MRDGGGQSPQARTTLTLPVTSTAHFLLFLSLQGNKLTEGVVAVESLGGTARGLVGGLVMGSCEGPAAGSVGGTT